MGMMKSVTPTCKYQHGLLTAVTSAGKTPHWALMAQAGTGIAFAVRMFMCPVCGYLELFDDDPVATIQQEGAE